MGNTAFDVHGCVCVCVFSFQMSFSHLLKGYTETSGKQFEIWINEFHKSYFSFIVY